MSRCLGYFVKDIKKPVTVLVATSGDTGGAVASGFYEIEGVDVVILYPSGKVSSVQELQLTTLGKNITAIEIDGNFDDCQQLVKQAFADEKLNEELFLTSANSINVARWLPQQFYYFFAYQQWIDKEHPPVVCVPSGNFGNICAGMVAHLTGLPVKHFVAAVNANDSVYKYLETGSYQSQQAVATISNAMDVGNPSNFIRILELFKHEYPEVKNVVSSFSISDEETRTTLKNIYSKYDYLLDPHGAVAFAGLEKYLEKHANEKGMILETAHPVKFYDVVEPITGQKVITPDTIKGILNKKKESVKLSPEYDSFKQFLLS
jgi:threonine synthase